MAKRKRPRRGSLKERARRKVLAAYEVSDLKKLVECRKLVKKYEKYLYQRGPRRG